MNSKICRIPGCSSPSSARGMCSVCYQRWWRKENHEKASKDRRDYYRTHPGISREYKQRWRTKNTELRNGQRRRNYERGAQHARNNWKPYDDFDDHMIFDKVIVDSGGTIIQENVSDRELARFIGRTVAAIQVRRHKLKKLGLSIC